jgi:predicted enzyme related to lactoylglutathione lyase
MRTIRSVLRASGADALRWEIDGEASDEVDLVPNDDTTFRIVFRPVPETKTGRNRIHLDLTTTSLDDQHESVSKLVELGARHIDIGQSPDEPHVVLADPEGNKFCVIQPENSFLAGCGRLRALTCDGSREVGYFWSNALGWPLVWDQNEETAIRAPTAPARFTGGGGPHVPKIGKNRLHLDIAPSDNGERHVEVDRLVSLGATEVDIGQGPVGWVIMSDPEGNEFCVFNAR